MPIDTYLQHYLPHLGHTCPKVEDLQTGDLLFPRLGDGMQVNQAIAFSELLESRTNNPQIQTLWPKWGKKVGDTLGNYLVADLKEMAKSPKFASLRTLDLSVAVAEALVRYKLNPNPNPGAGYQYEMATPSTQVVNHFNNTNSLYASPSGQELLRQFLSKDSLQWQATGGIPDNIMTDPKLLQMVIEVLIAADFGHLVDTWFNLSLSEFFKSPLVKLLTDFLITDDVHTNIFTGHVGIVICEKDGFITKGNAGGNVYVIEESMRSFSHYRVAIHPYYIKTDVDLVTKSLNMIEPDSTDVDMPSTQCSGWVNMRAAIREHTWHARPNDTTLPDGKYELLANAAKAMHGRPFGFFDQPDFGNDNRMYCVEFVYNVFKRGVSDAAGDAIKEKMSWGKMKNYLVAANNKKMLAFLDEILNDPNNIGYNKNVNSSFFVLAPALLWNSSALTHPLTLSGLTKPYAPVVQ